jgi:ppGpp synthetase/RelA/SpoT-type nucleotidyltranferase
VNKSEVDRLGERLRGGITAEDLALLDTFRRGFREAYDAVVGRMRSEVGLELSGRPAKSTPAIVEKLRRTSMRLTQMQDIAGCRVVVADIPAQGRLVTRLDQMFDVTVVDRRTKPSHGYRAVHVVVRESGLPVEVQVRTELQHSWAELSEKLADAFGSDLKYGGGPEAIRRTLDDFSTLVSAFEQHLDMDAQALPPRVAERTRKIRDAMLNLAAALRQHQ